MHHRAALLTVHYGLRPNAPYARYLREKMRESAELGEPVEFEWRRGFAWDGLPLFHEGAPAARSVGRFSGKVVGSVQFRLDLTWTVEGIMTLENDRYSWDLDATEGGRKSSDIGIIIGRNVLNERSDGTIVPNYVGTPMELICNKQYQFRAEGTWSRKEQPIAGWPGKR